MPRVIVAASSGTVFEYYDFLLYGSLVTFFGGLFFPPGNETAALLASLATFGAGFAMRPVGAILFGRLGDRVGRKRTFMITIVLMGASTAAVGILPTFESIGWWAPALLVFVRLVQGLALGGEFGGAALYVAEHAKPHQRGFYTSWIQTTGTVGLVLSLLVIVGCRTALGAEAFRAWGWRVPFLLSVLLLALSIYVRLALKESPLFAELQRTGGLSKSPISESLFSRQNAVPMLAALVVAAAMAISWYTAQFYSLVFLQTALLLDSATASILIVLALLLGVPVFVGAGALSDRFGRKPVMLVGMALATLSIMPAYRGLVTIGSPPLTKAQAANPVTVFALPTRFDPFADSSKLDAATRARDYLGKRGISYSNAAPSDDAELTIRVGMQQVSGFDKNALAVALDAAGYPKTSSVSRIERPGDLGAQHWAIIALIFCMIVGAGLTCGPGAAWLAEIFPTRIRYTSLSVPYHLTSAWFGGFMPLTAAWLVARTGDVFAGLWYPIVVIGTCFVLSIFLMKESRDSPHL